MEIIFTQELNEFCFLFGSEDSGGIFLDFEGVKSEKIECLIFVSILLVFKT